jgi:2-keto-4-pentenoate hydratase
MSETLTQADDKLAAAAARLRAAYGGEVLEPMRGVLAPTDAEGAYRVQQLNTQFWVDAGRRISGRKIGLTAESVRKQLGVDRPDYGVLFADTEVADGGVLTTRPRLIQPKAEAEVALVLARDLNDPNATPEDVAAAVDYAVAAIEIVDSRIRDWKITFADTVADNGSSAFYVLGKEKKKLAGLDLRTCGMALEQNGKVVSLGAGVACMGHPLIAAAWLARTLAELGDGLRAGEVILTGALGPMAAMSPGDHIEAAVGGLGSVSFTLEA